MRKGLFLLNAIFQLINLVMVCITSFGEPIYGRGSNEVHTVVAAIWQVLFIDFFLFLFAISGIITTYRQNREVRLFYVLFIPAVITAYFPQLLHIETDKEYAYAILLQYKPVVIVASYTITYLMLLVALFRKRISISSMEIE